MTILGAESYNGPRNSADLQAAGSWASPAALTGGGVPYGDPLQYRSLMRPVTAVSSSAYPFASASGNDAYMNVRRIGNAQDLYTAGGFWLGFTAACLRPSNNFVTNGTDIYGFTNIGTANTTTDNVIWSEATNTVINIGASTGLGGDPVYTGGKYYAPVSNTGWASGDTIPGTFTYTAFNISGNNGYYGFLPAAAPDNLYYVYGYVYAGGFQTRMWSSTTGGAGTWNIVSGSFPGGGVVNMFRVGGAVYAVSQPVDGSVQVSYLARSPDGVTWTNKGNTNARNGYQTMAASPTTVVVGGVGGRIFTSSDDGETFIQRSVGTTANVVSVVWTGTEFVAFLHNLDILYSADGETWTLKTRDLVPSTYDPAILSGRILVTTNGTFFVNSTYTFQWDTVNKRWDCLRAAASATLVNGAVTQPTGFFFGSGTSPTGTITGGRGMCGFVQYTSRLDAVGTASTSAWTLQQTINTDSIVLNQGARFEMSATAVPGQSVPTFDVQWIYNGTPSTTILRVTAASAAQDVYFTTASTGHNQWTNVVYGNMAGTRNRGPMGDVRILKKSNTTDVQAQWEKLPTDAASNAVAASGNGSLTLKTSSVQSLAVDDTDEYTGAPITIPAGYKVSALMVSAGAQRLGISTPSVTLGVIDNGAALPVATASLTGSTAAIVPMSQIYETTDSGESWDAASLATSSVAIKRTV